MIYFMLQINNIELHQNDNSKSNKHLATKFYI